MLRTNAKEVHKRFCDYEIAQHKRIVSVKNTSRKKVAGFNRSDMTRAEILKELSSC